MSQMLDFTKGRSRPANYINICRTLADTYTLGLSHGVQKDAIQNGFHTAIATKAKPLEFIFEFIKNKRGSFFTMTDSNTSGLVGEVLKTDNYDKLKESDHWARFEGFGFTTPNPDAIGARGQGKFIFLEASENHLMYYDSLRENGTYRLGATQATNMECPMLHWDEEDGRNKLKELTDLEPLPKTGTRIIIVTPIKELIDEIENDDFMSAIEETWFRAIEKGRLKVRIKGFDGDRTAKVPELFYIPSKDTPKIKVWRKVNDEVKLSGGERFRIKHLQIAYKKGGEIPERFKGVAIIHNDMKITSINIEGVPIDIANNIYGFIEFDTDLDRELRKSYNQNPNHYDLNWRRAIPQMIKNYVQEELRKFSYEKLKIGIDPRERRKQMRATAELDALRDLSKYASELGLFGKKGGVVPPPPPPPPPPPNKEIGLILHNFNFPEPERGPRVNWGETIKDFEVKIFNKTVNNIKGQLRIFMLLSEKEVTIIHDEKGINIIPRPNLKSFGPFGITFSKSTFPNPGEYRLRIRLIDEVSHTEIDCLTRKIWIEKDPGFRLPFEVLQDDFTGKGSIEKRQWITAGTLGQNPTLYYNTSHPAYKQAEEEEIQLSDYLFEIFLEGGIDFILNRPDKEDGTPDYHPLDSKEILKGPKDAYVEILSKIAEIRGRHYKEL